MASKSNSTFSVLGSDLSITGDITASADLHIDGSVEGDIACSALVQGESSTVKGAVKAETARLAGTVEGSITARELVILKTAKITGDVF
ncbi:cell shape determination protein CcmA, partial [Erythrobacter sp. HI0037]